MIDKEKGFFRLSYGSSGTDVGMAGAGTNVAEGAGTH